MSLIETHLARELYLARQAEFAETRLSRRAAATHRLQRRAARLSRRAERATRRAERAASQARLALARAI